MTEPLTSCRPQWDREGFLRSLECDPFFVTPYRPYQDREGPRGPDGQEGHDRPAALPRQARPHAPPHGHLAQGRCPPVHGDQVCAQKSHRFLSQNCWIFSRMFKESPGINIVFPPKQYLIFLTLSSSLATSGNSSWFISKFRLCHRFYSRIC